MSEITVLSNPILLAAALALGSATGAYADALYGATVSGGAGELYILDPATGRRQLRPDYCG